MLGAWLLVARSPGRVGGATDAEGSGGVMRFVETFGVETEVERDGGGAAANGDPSPDP